MVDQWCLDTSGKITASCRKCGAFAGGVCLMTFSGCHISERDMTLYVAERRTECVVDEIPF